VNALPRRKINRLNKEKRILDAALRIFSETGFSGASMDAIAVEAGVSKPTLYQYFGGKEQLFTAMLVPQREHMLKAFTETEHSDMVSALHAFAWDYASFVMRPDMLSLARLVIGEAQRFPAIGPAYQAAGPDRLLQGMVDYLNVQHQKGKLEFDDAELAAQDLWGLILSAPRTQALYKPQNIPGRKSLTRYINNGLRVFIKAYSINVNQDLKKLNRLTAGPLSTARSNNR